MAAALFLSHCQVIVIFVIIPSIKICVVANAGVGGATEAGVGAAAKAGVGAAAEAGWL